MKKFNLVMFALLFMGTFDVFFAQEESSDDKQVIPQEIGIDLNLSASTFGGTFGLGVKYGLMTNEKVIAGPSFRYQRTWSNFNGVKSSFNIMGAGAFLHYRVYDYFFLGGEVEFISTPFINGNSISAKKSLIPIALVGGGYSRALAKRFRLNAGIMYDVINNLNSPLRQGYFMRNKNGVLLPVIYRIAFFIPINYGYSFEKK